MNCILQRKFSSDKAGFQTYCKKHTLPPTPRPSHSPPLLIFHKVKNLEPGLIDSRANDPKDLKAFDTSLTCGLSINLNIQLMIKDKVKGSSTYLKGTISLISRDSP